ncbi:sarcosine oxidase subunit alpha [Nostoc sp. 3335mG]|nr:sarcosine oxidase subunit alpha [Nostoc sp. 3335mG]
MTEVAIIGAGPAGMSAALELQSRGAFVTVIDDAVAPGGRIFAAIEKRQPHGSEEIGGQKLVADFRARGGHYLAASEAWQIEPGPRVFLTQDGRARVLEPQFVILATGAQERPVPFRGWQLPGVMTVGGAQILLKTAKQIPTEPVWLAGTGPLMLLYARQLLLAGGEIAGILDISPPIRMGRVTRAFPAALVHGAPDLFRGVDWLVSLRKVRSISGVTAIRALGSDRLERISYETRRGETGEVSASLLLVHDGVVPGVHATFAAGCDHVWNEDQQCFQPVVDAFGESSVERVFVAGDGAGIMGAKAAATSGRLAAIGILRSAGLISDAAARRSASPLFRAQRRAKTFRRFLDALYPPSNLAIPDDAMLCRCEEVTAGTVRRLLRDRPHLGPGGVKSGLRVGMGPCQGRQCGLSLTRLVAETHDLSAAEAGFLRIRPPLKPLTLDELASLSSNQ